MLNIGPQELILVLIIALVVVGPKRLPELGRTIGRALREFRKIQDDVRDSIKFDMDLDADPVASPKPASGSTAPVGPDEDDGVPAPGPETVTIATTEPEPTVIDGDAEPRGAG